MKRRTRRHRLGNLWNTLRGASNTQRHLDAIEKKLDQWQGQLDHLSAIEKRLDQLQGQLDHLSATPLWGAVYMGNNRILTRYIVENRIIAFLLEADDLLLTPWFTVSGQYETEIAKFFVDNLRPNSRCLDIGANFGFYTCLMARFCPHGQVIGIEPVDTVYKLLRDNLFINGLNRHAAAIKAAVAQGPGRITLHHRKPRSANTSMATPSEALLQYHGESGFERFEIETVSIDGMLARFDNRIDFIKIDVEGAEPLVLRGAVETIRLNPQLQIVMEWSPHQIRDAGFDVDEFISELSSSQLCAAIIRPFGLEKISLPALLNIEYAAGILLSNDPPSLSAQTDMTD
jgi:FkbM family methyltransferase